MTPVNVILIDNYDSFTYNLAQYLEEQGAQLQILRNDEVSTAALEECDAIVISPGPGVPRENGSILEIIQTFSGKKPILGVCLGLQAIYEALGGKLTNLSMVHHGVSSEVVITDPFDPIYEGISSPFLAGRYHSWVCDPLSLPQQLLITAIDQEGAIMSCRHKEHHTFGIQYHPESILTLEGKKIVGNFVRMI